MTAVLEKNGTVERHIRAEFARHGLGHFWAYANRSTWNVAFLVFYHLTRVPWYCLKLAVFFVPGSWFGFVAWLGWVLDFDGAEDKRVIRSAVGGKKKTGTGITQSQAMRDKHIKNRSFLSAGVCIAAAVGLYLAEPYVRVSANLLFVGGLGHLGHHRLRGESFLSEPDRNSAPAVDKALMAEALDECGIPRLSAKLRTDGVKAFRMWAGRSEDNRGQQFELDLSGATAAQVILKEDNFIGHLGRTSATVWLEPDPSVSPNRLIVTVLDKEPTKADIRDFVRPESVDVFEPIEVGLSPRGKPRSITFIYQTMLLGAVARSGKSFAIRLLCVLLALDDRTRFFIFELKGTGDLKCMKRIADVYFQGDTEEDIVGSMEAIRELGRIFRWRKDRLAWLDDNQPNLVPENKISRELASDPNEHFPVLVIVMDEFQALSTHAEYGKEYAAFKDLMLQQGQTVGMISIDATQRPDGGKVAPSIRDKYQLRACFRVMSHTANDMVLGSESHKRGFKATKFTPDDVGMSYVRAEEADPFLCQWDHLSVGAANEIMLEVEAHRREIGLLAGHSVGESFGDAEPDTSSLNDIDYILQVWPEDVEWMTSAQILAKLQKDEPGRFDSHTPAKITTATKTRSVVKTIDGHRGRFLNRPAVAAQAESRL